MNTSCRPCSGPSLAQVCNGMQRHLTVCDGVCDGVLGAISRTGTVSLFPIQLHRYTVTNRHKPSQTGTNRYVPLHMSTGTVSLFPIQLHALLLCLFASLVAPFGGFFASGIKRAYKVRGPLQTPPACTVT